MVRSAETRIANYQNALDPDVVRTKLANRKARMVEQQQARQAEIAQVQDDVSTILDNLGVPPELRMTFIKVAMKIYGLTKKFEGTTLQNEAKLVLDLHYNKYKTVLATTVLGNILTNIANYFGITWTPPTSSG